MKSYETARNLFSFLGFCAGALIALGVVIGLLGGSAVQSMGRSVGFAQVILGAMPGIIMAATGLVGQAMVQMGRASVDTAECTQQALAVSRQQLELSKQLLEQGKTTAASFASLSSQRSAPTPNGSDTATGASYASQSKTSVQTPSADNASVAISNGASTPANAIPKKEPTSLPQLSHDIVYQDGKFVVGDKRFWSKKEAIDFQQTLVSEPAK